MQNLTKWITILGLVGVMLTIAWIGDWSIFSDESLSMTLLHLLGVLLVLVFVVSPYALLIVSNHFLSKSSAGQSVLLASSILCSASWAYILWTVFFYNQNPDAQDGLVLIFLPIYQALVVAILCGFAFGASVIEKSFESP